MDTTILDCTLRDGGYYNNWDFDRSLVESYLSAMASSHIGVVEIGFRMTPRSGFHGPYAFCKDTFLASLSIPAGIKVAVMVNASDILSGQHDALEAISHLFSASDDSPVDLVRVACHGHEVSPALPICDWLHRKGYSVALNIMQASDKTDAQLNEYAKSAAQHNIDILYLADSFGSMTPDDISRSIDCIKNHWDGPVGVHTHDNMGLALQNTLTAMQSGATWADCTVLGMGRGPGNTKTELLVIESGFHGTLTGKLSDLFSLAENRFKPMQSQFKWGPNPYYYLAGKHSIHPTFVQKMLADTRFGGTEVIAVIDHLREVGGKRFDASALDTGRQIYKSSTSGDWAPSSSMQGRTVLLIGPGPNVHRHLSALTEFINVHRPFVMALNLHLSVDETLIDVRVASHPYRILADADLYTRFRQPIIMPKAQVNELFSLNIRNEQVFDFGLTVEADTFSFEKTRATTPNTLVAAYGLAICASGKARNILLAGFDGFPAGDPRADEMNSTLSLFSENPSAPPVTAITQTSYNVPIESVYCL